MRTSSILLLLLAAGTLHARAFVPPVVDSDPRTRSGAVVQGGEIVVKASSDVNLSPGRIEAEPTTPLSAIELRRDFRDSPPENLVRGTLETANGEND